MRVKRAVRRAARWARRGGGARATVRWARTRRGVGPRGEEGRRVRVNGLSRQGRKRTGRAHGKEENGPVSGLGRDRKRKGSGLGCWGLGRPGAKRATWAGFASSPFLPLFFSFFWFSFFFSFFYSTNSNYLNSNLNLNSTLALKQIKQCTSMNATNMFNLK